MTLLSPPVFFMDDQRKFENAEDEIVCKDKIKIADLIKAAHSDDVSANLEFVPPQSFPQIINKFKISEIDTKTKENGKLNYLLDPSAPVVFKNSNLWTNRINSARHLMPYSSPLPYPGVPHEFFPKYECFNRENRHMQQYYNYDGRDNIPEYRSRYPPNLEHPRSSFNQPYHSPNDWNYRPESSSKKEPEKSFTIQCILAMNTNSDDSERLRPPNSNYYEHENHFQSQHPSPHNNYMPNIRRDSYNPRQTSTRNIYDINSTDYSKANMPTIWNPTYAHINDQNFIKARNSSGNNSDSPFSALRTTKRGRPPKRPVQS
ncbi:hypothetical protein HZS_1065 [Henneguya salminicola]|nr:hypothetical protein HZS_1065 [Henneguya salminicola]